MEVEKNAVCILIISSINVISTSDLLKSLDQLNYNYFDASKQFVWRVKI